MIEKTPIICIAGKSESGKTTLIEKLIPELKKRGYSIGSIKHSCQRFDIDKKGKDSWRHRKAGADIVVIASTDKIAMIKDNDPWNRGISARLYTGDIQQRLRQEIVLGIGGSEVLKKLGIKHSILHLFVVE